MLAAGCWVRPEAVAQLVGGLPRHCAYCLGGELRSNSVSEPEANDEDPQTPLGAYMCSRLDAQFARGAGGRSRHAGGEFAEANSVSEANGASRRRTARTPNPPRRVDAFARGGPRYEMCSRGWRLVAGC